MQYFKERKEKNQNLLKRIQ